MPNGSKTILILVSARVMHFQQYSLPVADAIDTKCVRKISREFALAYIIMYDVSNWYILYKIFRSHASGHGTR